MENLQEEINTIYLKANVCEIYAVTEITQYYQNSLENPVELFVSFPLRSEFKLTKFTAKIGKKLIVSKILEKEKAKEKYNDALANGNVAATGSSIDDYNFDVSVGNLASGEKIELKSEYVQMISSEDMSYCYSLIQTYPSFRQHSEKLQKIKINRKIVGEINISTKSKLTKMIVNHSKQGLVVNKKINQDGLGAKLTIKDGNNSKPKVQLYSSINILFRTAEINIPKLYS